MTARLDGVTTTSEPVPLDDAVRQAAFAAVVDRAVRTFRMGLPAFEAAAQRERAAAQGTRTTRRRAKRR
jgi:hypothetical protein